MSRGGLAETRASGAKIGARRLELRLGGGSEARGGLKSGLEAKN